MEISHLPERVQGDCHEYAQWTTQENKDQTENFNRKYKEEPNRAEEYNNWNKNILGGKTVNEIIIFQLIYFKMFFVDRKKLHTQMHYF